MPLTAQELSQRAKEGSAVTIRNTRPGITVFTDDTLKLTTEWYGHEDGEGRHIRQVSAAYLNNPEFRAALQKGIFVIEEDEAALEASIEASRIGWESREQAREDGLAAIERMSAKTINKGGACIVPVGKNICGNIGMILGTNPKTNPPICSEHSHLRSQYEAVPSGKIVGGEEELIWRRKQPVPSA